MANTSNDFSKTELVLFEEELVGFEDALVISNEVKKWMPNDQTMERANNTVWRPQPYVMASRDGSDQTGNFYSNTQLSVPASLSFRKVVPFTMTGSDLRDREQMRDQIKGAVQKLASDINISIITTASLLGSLVVARPNAAGTYFDAALCQSMMNEQGVPHYDRCLALGTRDYNGMSSDLAARQTLTTKALEAYDSSFIGPVAQFKTYVMDYAHYQDLADPAIALTINGADQYYIPRSTEEIVVQGQVHRPNVDNRFQTINVLNGSPGNDPVAGDCFTIDGIFATHQVSKQPTGQLKTFRVTNYVDAGGGVSMMTITPPIISPVDPTVTNSNSNLQYQNVDSIPADGAIINFINIQDSYANTFWSKGSLEIMGGRLAVDDLSPNTLGVEQSNSAYATTENGLQVVLTKFFDIELYEYRYRLDALYGVTNLNPQMNGILLFNQQP